MPVAFARISATPLDLSEHLDAVTRPEYGAVTLFLGVVRDHDPDVTGKVAALEYSCHPDAERILQELVAEYSKSDGVLVAASHRIGHLVVGESALIVTVAAAHRGELFDVCRDVVAAIKARVPIWKRQLLTDGTHTWVGL